MTSVIWDGTVFLQVALPMVVLRRVVSFFVLVVFCVVLSGDVVAVTVFFPVVGGVSGGGVVAARGSERQNGTGRVRSTGFGKALVAMWGAVRVGSAMHAIKNTNTQRR